MKAPKTINVSFAIKVLTCKENDPVAKITFLLPAKNGKLIPELVEEEFVICDEYMTKSWGIPYRMADRNQASIFVESSEFIVGDTEEEVAIEAEKLVASTKKMLQLLLERKDGKFAIRYTKTNY
jgi:hypothetical protein